MLGNAIADNITIYTLHENNTFFTIHTHPSIHPMLIIICTYVKRFERILLQLQRISTHTHTLTYVRNIHKGQYVCVCTVYTVWQVNRLLFIFSSYISRFCCVFTNLISFVSAFPHIYFECVCFFCFVSRYVFHSLPFFSGRVFSLSLCKRMLAARTCSVYAIIWMAICRLSFIYIIVHCQITHTHTKRV